MSQCILRSLQHLKASTKFLSLTSSNNLKILGFRYRNANSTQFRLIHSTLCRLANGDEHRVQTPPFAESITEGDIRWLKAEGDNVSADEIVGEVETDKTSVPVSSPVSGVISKIMVEDGERGSEAKPATVSEAPAKLTKAESSPKENVSAPVEIPTSLPPISKMPTEPIKTMPPFKQVSQKPINAASISTAPSARSEHRVRMNRMRLKISSRLKQAQNTAAMLTTFNEIDMSSVMELRAKHKEEFLKRHGVKMSIMAPFMRASAYALMDQPAVNAVIDDSTNEIVYRDYVDISVAVATPKGLVVPVIRNCEKMDFLECDRELARLGKAARDGQLAIEDMDGGTFTISNGGVFGSLFGTPIINPPQSAILGMHGVFERPVARNGQVVIRPMMYVALTYDHRLIDGREAALFLRKIKSAVEDPRYMFLRL